MKRIKVIQYSQVTLLMHKVEDGNDGSPIPPYGSVIHREPASSSITLHWQRIQAAKLEVETLNGLVLFAG